MFNFNKVLDNHSSSKVLIFISTPPSPPPRRILNSGIKKWKQWIETFQLSFYIFVSFASQDQHVSHTPLPCYCNSPRPLNVWHFWRYYSNFFNLRCRLWAWLPARTSRAAILLRLRLCGLRKTLLSIFFCHGQILALEFTTLKNSGPRWETGPLCNDKMKRFLV